MRFVLAAGALAVATLAGCDTRANETGRVGESVDTVVTTQQTRDTALITHDTTVDVDTTVKEGTRATGMDTVENTTGQQQPPVVDTTAP